MAGQLCSNFITPFCLLIGSSHSKPRLERQVIGPVIFIQTQVVKSDRNPGNIEGEYVRSHGTLDRDSRRSLGDSYRWRAGQFRNVTGITRSSQYITVSFDRTLEHQFFPLVRDSLFFEIIRRLRADSSKPKLSSNTITKRHTHDTLCAFRSISTDGDFEQSAEPENQLGEWVGNWKSVKW